MARDGETTVFVEVKARATAEFGTAAEAVTRRKQRQLASMARDYLARTTSTTVPCRFDVVAIDGVGESAVITVYPDAFDGVRSIARSAALPVVERVWYSKGFGRTVGAGLCVRTAGGNNSVVECDLAKVEVAGSNPVSRSNS